MEMLDLLKAGLLELHKELPSGDIRLIVGGGYGLYLKQQHLQHQNQRTLLNVEIWPEARSTNDLDVFLAAEVVTDSTRMKAIKAALDRLGYTPIESAKYYQFVKPMPLSRHIKLDLMAGPLGEYEARVKTDARRIRPRPSVHLHARRVDEALDLEHGCMGIELEGSLPTGEYHRATVYVPPAFTYLLMKLLAFRDRMDDDDKDLGRHHALDILRIVAMMTKDEYEDTAARFQRHADQPFVQDAADMVRRHFADEDSIGVIRIREHPLFRREIDLPAFLRDARALLPR
jgi:hypothetical protein